MCSSVACLTRTSPRSWKSHSTSRTPAYTSCPPYNMAALPRGRSLKVLGVQVDTVDAKTVDDRWVIAVALGGGDPCGSRTIPTCMDPGAATVLGQPRGSATTLATAFTYYVSCLL